MFSTLGAVVFFVAIGVIFLLTGERIKSITDQMDDNWFRELGRKWYKYHANKR